MIKFRGNSWFLPSLAGLFLWGGWGFLPKLAMQTLSPQSVVFYEAIGCMIVSLPVLIYLKGKLEVDRKGITITAISSGIGIIALLAYFHALQIGPVATVVTLTALYPVIGLILAFVILKEKINRLQWVAIGMAIGAMMLLAG